MYINEALDKSDKIRLPHWPSDFYLRKYSSALYNPHNDSVSTLEIWEVLSDKWEIYNEPISFYGVVVNGLVYRYDSKKQAEEAAKLMGGRVVFMREVVDE